MEEFQRVFNFRSQELRTVEHDNQPWFVAIDVCNILEIKNPSDALKRLEDDERARFNLGRQGEANIINESGLYELIFASRKPEAKVFKKWVKQEVLPSIRKTGSYSTQETPKTHAEKFLEQAKAMVEYEQRINNLESQAAAAHHRIDNFDKIDTMGNLQQRLNKMIRMYAAKQGLTFKQAWRNFKGAFNTAYRTNLTMLIENYKMKHNLTKLSTPEYFSKVDRLDDAIRVADKLLNQSQGNVANIGR